MNTIAEIEAAMAEVLMIPDYREIQSEYHRLLSIMGNVDGDEVISLVAVAIANVRSKA